MCIGPVAPVNVEVLKNAYTAMNSIMEFTLLLVKNALPDYTIGLISKRSIRLMKTNS